MNYDNLKKEDLIALLEEKEEALAVKDAEKDAEIAAKDEKLAVLESQLRATQSVNADVSAMNPFTKRIVESERNRKTTMKTLFIPEDPDPEASNTWSCAINNKQYLVPRGEEVEVPLAVYEMYQEQVANEKKARAAILKAKKTVEDGENK